MEPWCIEAVILAAPLLNLTTIFILPFQDETEQPKKEEGEEEESVKKVEEIDEKGDVEKGDVEKEDDKNEDDDKDDDKENDHKEEDDNEEEDEKDLDEKEVDVKKEISEVKSKSSALESPPKKAATTSPLKSGEASTTSGTSPLAKVEKVKGEEKKGPRTIQVEEFLVKFKNFSYLHCQWQTEAELLRYISFAVFIRRSFQILDFPSLLTWFIIGN